MILDKIWRARRNRNKLDRELDKWIGKREKLKGEARDMAEGEIHILLSEREWASETIGILESNSIVDKAEQLGVPVPQFSDKTSWQTSDETNRVFLNVTARARLRADIYKERRERAQDRMLWINQIAPFIALLTGLVGSLAALASVASVLFK